MTKYTNGNAKTEKLNRNGKEVYEFTDKKGKFNVVKFFFDKDKIIKEINIETDKQTCIFRLSNSGKNGFFRIYDNESDDEVALINHYRKSKEEAEEESEDNDKDIKGFDEGENDYGRNAKNLLKTYIAKLINDNVKTGKVGITYEYQNFYDKIIVRKEMSLNEYFDEKTNEEKEKENANLLSVKKGIEGRNKNVKDMDNTKLSQIIFNKLSTNGNLEKINEVVNSECSNNLETK